jgi:hypothetical protein
MTALIRFICGPAFQIPNDASRELETSVVGRACLTPVARAPHVFPSDGKTSIFDLYGPDFTIVDFIAAGAASEEFIAVANKLSIPITMAHLPNETHCRAIWERDVVLVRPDGFVAWRIPPEGAKLVGESEIKMVLQIAAGRASVLGYCN